MERKYIVRLQPEEQKTVSRIVKHLEEWREVKRFIPGSIPVPSW